MATSESCLLRIFIGESDRVDGKPMYEWLVREAKARGMAGATVLRGIMGFGAHTKMIHTFKIERLSEDLPIVIEIVDAKDKIEDFLTFAEGQHSARHPGHGRICGGAACIVGKAGLNIAAASRPLSRQPTRHHHAAHLKGNIWWGRHPPDVLFGNFLPSPLGGVGRAEVDPASAIPGRRGPGTRGRGLGPGPPQRRRRNVESYRVARGHIQCAGSQKQKGRCSGEAASCRRRRRSLSKTPAGSGPRGPCRRHVPPALPALRH